MNLLTRFKELVQRFVPRNSFARSVGLLVGGTAGAQVLTVLVSPVLTRLYTAEDFGVLAVYASVLSLILVVASLRYELAIPLPEDDLDAVNLTALGFFLVFLLTFFTACAVWLSGEYIIRMLNASQLKPYLWLLPLSVFFGGIYGLFRYWSVRIKTFGAVAKTSLQQALVSICIQLAGYKLGGAVCCLLKRQAKASALFLWEKHILKTRCSTE